MSQVQGRRGPCLLFYFCRLLTVMLFLGLAAPVARAQEVQGWRLHQTPHFLLYTVDGSPGARDLPRVAEQLERLHTQVLNPLRLPPAQIIYPLYPSVDRFRADWWLFATLGHGDLVHGWGAVYDGDLDTLTPYGVTRAAVTHAFPRAIPFLRWGLGDALADRAAGADPHQHLRALAAAGQPLPDLPALLAPSDFGRALPVSYPVAVSFAAFLLETYGPARVADFVERVAYRYFDFGESFPAEFGTSLAAAEREWRRHVASDARSDRLDLPAYFAVTRFIYRTSLAGSPARLMLEPQGAVVVTEAFRAALPLRRLDVRTAQAHLETAERADEQAERRQRLTTGTVRALIGALVVSPILLAVGWLLWPTVRAHVADSRRRKAVARRKPATGAQ